MFTHGDAYIHALIEYLLIHIPDGISWLQIPGNDPLNPQGNVWFWGVSLWKENNVCSFGVNIYFNLVDKRAARSNGSMFISFTALTFIQRWTYWRLLMHENRQCSWWETNAPRYHHYQPNIWYIPFKIIMDENIHIISNDLFYKSPKALRDLVTHWAPVSERHEHSNIMMNILYV